MKHLKLLISACLLFFVSNLSYSQSNHDNQTWITLDAAYEFPWSTELAIENETRLYNQSSLFGRNQTDFSVSYIFNNHWSAGLGYRAKLSYPFSDYSMLTHRFFSEVKWKTRISKKYRINARLRIINDQETFSDSPLNELVHREKFRFGFKIPETPFLVYTGFETYFPLNTSTLLQIQKFRIETGLKYSISKKTDVSLDCIFDREFDQSVAETLFAVQIGFSIKLGNSKEE